MAEMKLSLKEIKELMDKLSDSKLGRLRIKEGDFELEIEAKEPEYVPQFIAPAAQPVAPSSISSAPAAVSLPEAPAPAGKVVKSPIVGTFYAASAPGKEPFVEIGSRVKKGDVLFVIESMKLMNEITSEFDGEVAEILVENAQGVEYNQPVMIII